MHRSQLQPLLLCVVARALQPADLRTCACAVLRCAVLCCAVLCCAVLCCAVLCCAVLCCAVLFCVLLLLLLPLAVGRFSSRSSSGSSRSVMAPPEQSDALPYLAWGTPPPVDDLSILRILGLLVSAGWGLRAGWSGELCQRRQKACLLLLPASCCPPACCLLPAEFLSCSVRAAVNCPLQELCLDRFEYPGAGSNSSSSSSSGAD